MSTVDRSETSRALAKAIAYKECGFHKDAAYWARRLVRLLECADILAPEGELVLCEAHNGHHQSRGDCQWPHFSGRYAAR